MCPSPVQIITYSLVVSQPQVSLLYDPPFLVDFICCKLCCPMIVTVPNTVPGVATTILTHSMIKIKWGSFLA
jgi:hypothetical protein